MSTTPLKSELIIGAKQIAAAIGITPRRVYALADKGSLPTLKIGSTIAMRRDRIAEWIKSLERDSDSATDTAH